MTHQLTVSSRASRPPGSKKANSKVVVSSKMGNKVANREAAGSSKVVSKRVSPTGAQELETPLVVSTAPVGTATGGPASPSSTQMTSGSGSVSSSREQAKPRTSGGCSRQEGFEAGDLDDIIQRMRELDDLRTYQDVAEIARLQTFVLDELKRFEYRLRREVDSENEELYLASSDEVPPGFRDLIEEYYRVLSRDN